MVPDYLDQYKGLWEISRNNKLLRWIQINRTVEPTSNQHILYESHTDYVLMTTVTTLEELWAFPVNASIYTVDRIWATAYPQVKLFCTSSVYSLNASTSPIVGMFQEYRRVVRVLQYLGLNFDFFKHSPRYVVSFWVKPEDIVRPCLKPSVSRVECDLTYVHQLPNGSFVLRLPSDFDLNELTVEQRQHYEWFSDTVLHRNIYNLRMPGPQLFPWTRLGYTYDWGTFDDVHFGASEFLIQLNSSITIEGVETLQSYCKV